MQTCCVASERMLSESELMKVSNDILQSIEELIEKGYTRFLFGFASNADLMFARLVAMHKQDDPRLQLHAVFSSPAEYASALNVPRNRRLLSVCDEIHILREDVPSDLPSAQERFLIENSETVVAVFSVETLELPHSILSLAYTHNRFIFYCLF